MAKATGEEWQILEAQTADRLHWFIVPGTTPDQAIAGFVHDLLTVGTRLVDSDGNTVEASDLIKDSVRELSEHLKPKADDLAIRYTIYGDPADVRKRH